MTMIIAGGTTCVPEGTGMASFDEQIQTAIVAHGMWKARLRDAIQNGNSSFQVDAVRRDDQCDFGRWLYGDAHRAHGTDPHFEVVRSLHAGFHGEAAKVLGFAVSGDRSRAEASMGTWGPFNHVSGALIIALTRWRDTAA